MTAVRLAILAVLLFTIGLQFDVPVFDRLVVMIMLLLAIAWLWKRSALNHIGIQRSIPVDRVRVGDDIVEHIEFFNRSWFPRLWIKVLDHSTLPGHASGRVISMKGRGSERWQQHTVAQRRGRYRLGPFRLVSGDPFGIFTTQTVVPVEHEVVVYPPSIDTSMITLPLATMSGGRQVAGRQAMSTPTISGIRDYIPGDALNHISWSATARRGTMMVKEFDPDPTSDLWVVLDLGEDGQFDLDDPAFTGGSLPHVANNLTTTVEYIVAIASALTERAIADGRKVGIVINRDLPIRIEPDNTSGHLFRVMEVLAVATPYGNRSVQEALQVEGRRFLRSQGVIVISADPAARWGDAARALVQRRVQVTAVIVDAGGVGEDDVAPIIGELATAGVHVQRYPTHTVLDREWRSTSLRGAA